MSAITTEQLNVLRPFLEQLQKAFLLIGSDGVIDYGSSMARQLFGRRLNRHAARLVLGDSLYEQLCRPILDGALEPARWREAEIQLSETAQLAVGVQGFPVEWAEKGQGVLILLDDISGEVGLHQKYKVLLERQRKINRELRREIASKLREHEDDLSQFTELLQLAPNIFASFAREANDAVDTAEMLLKHETPEQLLIAFRAMHTLKGNARSLGLNLIGGRAHAIEDQLERIRSKGGWVEQDRREALEDLFSDLRRAITRAHELRVRLGEVTAQPSTTAVRDRLDFYDQIVTLQGLLDETRKHVSDERAMSLVSQAMSVVDRMGSVPLKTLFEQLEKVCLSTKSAAPKPLLVTNGETLNVSPTLYRAFADATSHLVRNAIVHGIEPEEERTAKGKPSVGTIHFRAWQEAQQLNVSISDDGRGVDLDRLKRRASEQGLDPERYTASELVFTAGISTAADVTLDGGRGIGTNAAKEAIETIGGRIALTHTGADGTTFLIQVPLPS